MTHHFPSQIKQTKLTEIPIFSVNSSFLSLSKIIHKSQHFSSSQPPVPSPASTTTRNFHHLSPHPHPMTSEVLRSNQEYFLSLLVQAILWDLLDL
jgi:hypothetical protein